GRYVLPNVTHSYFSNIIQGEGWISRQASGLCFDFAPDDPSTYVTGTEEGSLHRCSVSYSEQYLDTYDSHGGPVYRLRPWWGDIFLSCSADWTMSLYHMRSTWPLLTFHSSGEDFSVFAAVTADAKLQLWDISVSDIDPVISLDTNLDVADLLASEAATEAASAAGATMGVMRKGAATASTAPGTRRDYGSHRDAQREDSEKDTPVTRLLKNLANGNGNAARRTLTTVTFSANSPVAVVGDSTGVVTVYRVNDPQTITEEGNPAGQILKLKE
ncbi:Dnai4, partial [Symbiodinium microadriaticum]